MPVFCLSASRISTLGALALAIGIALSSCSRTTPVPWFPIPVISGIQPSSGPAQSTDTITGTGFSTQASGDSVYFNGTPAAVVQAGTTQLIVTVPAQGGTGKVTVKVGVFTATGPVFTYDTTAVVTDSVMVSTLAGSGLLGTQDGTGQAASFQYLDDVAADRSGNVYVSEELTHVIRKITPAGVVSTLTGASPPGWVSGPPNWYYPLGMVVDQYDTLFIGDGALYYVFTVFNGVSKVFAGDGTKSTNGDWEVDQFTNPTGLAVDKNENVYVVDNTFATIKKITPDGWVSLLAGGVGVPGGTDGTGAAAGFNQPRNLTVDSSGNLYVADAGDQEIRKITPGGVVTTLAGNLSGNGMSVDGVGAAANFSVPMGIAMDGSGNLYVADNLTGMIRKVTPGGVVTTIAGTGEQGAKDGPGKTATFNRPTAIAIDGSGNLYVSDAGNYKVRKIVIKH
jgi:serine/threonine protein kinase, bacterial